MKYTKPSGPYIAILAILFIVSMISHPMGKSIYNNTKDLGVTISNEDNTLKNSMNQNISMIKIEKND